MKGFPTMSTRLHVVLALLLIATSPCSAGEEDPPRVDCANPGNTYEFNICSDREFVAADSELNAIYKKVVAKIATDGGDKPYDAKAREAALRSAQRAWIAYRDADCKGALPLDWGGGTGTTAAVLGCMIEKTKRRTREMVERYGLE